MKTYQVEIVEKIVFQVSVEAAAETEAGEFWEIYKLDVVTIPTNKPVLRNDMPDRVYKTQNEKFNAVIAEIEKMRNSGRPGWFSPFPCPHLTVLP